MTQYENQLAALRLEVRRLRNYDCFAKEVKYEDLETEVITINYLLKGFVRIVVCGDQLSVPTSLGNKLDFMLVST